MNDRGPFKNGRIIDLSTRAAQLLGFHKQGTAKVLVEILAPESRQLASVTQSRDGAIPTPRAVPVVAGEQAPLVGGVNGNHAAGPEPSLSGARVLTGTGGAGDGSGTAAWTYHSGHR